MEVVDILKLIAVFASLAFVVGATYWMAYDFGKCTQKKQMWRDMEDFPDDYIEKIKKRAEIRKQNDAIIERHERQRAFERETKKRKVR